MADVRMIERLADLREFEELRRHIEESEEEAVKTLARKTYALPEAHERLEWEKLKAYYAGARAVLDLPLHVRKSNRKESR